LKELLGIKSNQKIKTKQNQGAHEEVAKTVQIVRRATDKAGNEEFVKCLFFAQEKQNGIFR
jgi:hypothetical protein